MAVACAIAFDAQKLLFLTDVEGVKGDAGQILPSLTAEGCQALISSKIATGGMQAKLDASTHALSRGIAEVVIAPGAASGVVGRLLAGESLGTVLSRGDAEATRA